MEEMDEPTIRRRNVLKNHYTMTSNVIIFGYAQLTDAEKLTYQAIDSFDWSDEAGKRKGYAFPSLRTLSRLRGVDERTLRRHLAALESAELMRREQRAGRPSLLWIEEPSEEESQRYLSTIAIGPDTDVRGAPDADVRPYIETDKDQKKTKPLTRAKASETQKEPERRYRLSVEQKGRCDAVVADLLHELKDDASIGYYRKAAQLTPAHALYEALSEVRVASAEGRVRKTKGALFTAIVERRRRSAERSVMR